MQSVLFLLLKKVADDYKALLPNHLNISAGRSSYPIGMRYEEEKKEEGHTT
jgi:hypothetical protein